MAEERFDFLIGQRVDEIRVWGPFRLIFDRGEPGSEAYLDVEGAAHLWAGETTSEINFFTDGDPVQAGKLVSLLWQQIVGAYEEKGVLHLSFENGAELKALPQESGESWTLIGNGRKVICLAGGELAFG